MKKLFYALSLALTALAFFSAFCLTSGCRRAAGKPRIYSLRHLNVPSFRIGSMTGIAALRVAREHFPDAAFFEYSMPVDAFTALCAGKIDAVVLDRPTLEYMAMAHPELVVYQEDLATVPIAAAAARRSVPLMDAVNSFIAQYRQDGTYQAMVERWFHTPAPAMPEIPSASTADVLKVGVTANNEPFCFIRNGELVGFDAEFARRFAACAGKRVRFIDLPYDALVPALESGKIDLAIACMDAMPERFESVLFSNPYIDSPITVLLRKERLGITAGTENSGSFRHELWGSFEKTFLRENRWKLILQGLGTTLLITFFAVIFGTVLAFPVCRMCRSSHPVAAWLGERYVSIIMGTPVLVILLILYYVIFAKVNVSGIVVAVIAFALDFAAGASVTLRSGIDSVPREQTEAALALGHTPMAAFRRFVLPQAVRTMLPVYRSEIISTLKATSVVGFIAVMDLTKMGDIIRSRTYEAFFPLIAIAVIYFLTAKGITMLLARLGKRLDPNERRARLIARSSL